MDSLDKGKIRIRGRTEQGGVRCHHGPPHRARFKTYKLSLSGIVHVIFLDCARRRVTELREIETTKKDDGK